MAKKKKYKVDTAGDIPAWFMTYSDVVTLLMTFFILLMTFSTHSPERTEKSRVTFFQSSGGTGLIGATANRPANDSWVNRIRTNAAKIAMRGSEMPPITEAPASQAIGNGLMSLTEKENNQDDISTHYFDIKLDEIIDHQNGLTAKGLWMAQMLANQLRGLPVECSLQISKQENTKRATALASNMFDEQKVRPGLVSVSVVPETLPADSIRILIERHNNPID